MFVACTFVMAVFWSLTGAEPSVEDQAKQDAKQLQGFWEYVSAEEDGQEMLQKHSRIHAKIEFRDGNLIRHIPRFGEIIILNYTFKLETSSSPRLIDFTQDDKRLNGHTFEGIYEINGDQLKLCYHLTPDGKKRPTEFVGKDGNVLIIFKRVKP